ncbi:MAG: hypothetical protein V4501_11135 [Pseudomonadota bacterium]
MFGLYGRLASEAYKEKIQVFRMIRQLPNGIECHLSSDLRSHYCDITNTITGENIIIANRDDYKFYSQVKDKLAEIIDNNIEMLQFALEF